MDGSIKSAKISNLRENLLKGSRPAALESFCPEAGRRKLSAAGLSWVVLITVAQRPDQVLSHRDPTPLMDLTDFWAYSFMLSGCISSFCDSSAASIAHSPLRQLALPSSASPPPWSLLNIYNTTVHMFIWSYYV